MVSSLNFILIILLVLIGLLVLVLVCYYVTKAISIGFYEAKLHYNNKLKETNNVEDRPDESNRE